MRIAVCDDEKNLRRDLRRLVEIHMELKGIPCEIVEYESGERFLGDKEAGKTDILFLDIDLGTKNGIELARIMRKHNAEAVLILVTNFSEYAPEGYEVDAFRYLPKAELDQKLPGYFSDALVVCRTRQRKVEIFCEGESMPVPV